MPTRSTHPPTYAPAGLGIAILVSLASLFITPFVRADQASGVEFFEKNIRPLLVERCYECHSGSEANGGLLLDSRQAVRRGGDTGPALVEGEPERSLLVHAVRYTKPELQMPPKGSLSPAEIALLEKWVALGAPDPREEPTSAAAPMGMSVDEGRSFWSFRPVDEPTVPEVKETSWLENPIDAFIRANLDAKGMATAPRADRRTLIRRVTFDLVGLPPTPREVDDFLGDASPDAWERLTDRLLASPAYGVRWGRHWLDVARYADSNGLDENLAFGNAWRYRDYVVDSLNRDKPFDAFLIEQLAGDLLPDANPETLTATGFLVLGAKVLAEPDREKLTMDTIDEQLDTVGKAFWGMTLGCVRCHDHKFDPFQQSDYYGLAAVFKSTKTFGDTNFGAIKHWNEHSFASEDERARLKEVDAKIAKLKEAATAFKNKETDRIRSDARQKVVEYLKAAALFDPQASLAQVEEIAGPAGLHPRILFHCRQHLEFHRDDPLFVPWHEMSARHDEPAIEAHYRPLFTQAASAETSDAPADPLVTAARGALNDAAGLLAVPPKPEFALDPDALAEYHRLSDEARLYESAAPDESAAMGVSEAVVLTSLPIHVRGSHLNLGEPIERHFPAVMASLAPPELPSGQSGRLELARWMAHPDHPLTARVYVNRLWRWHFGRGIVATTDNFGKLGERPTHPELLDWLARRLVETGWSTKQIHRWILTSSLYRTSSAHPADESLAATDPDNTSLYKFPRQRLEAEQLRDAILFVAGRLDQSMGGKSIPLRNRQFVFDHTSIDHTKYDSVRRSIYLPIVRNNLYTLFEQFDFPDPTMPTGSRHATVVASQALFLMNADLVIDSAGAMARTLLNADMDDRSRVETAYEETLQRTPSDAEIERALRFIRAESDTADPLAGWTLFCQALLASNEFIDLR